MGTYQQVAHALYPFEVIRPSAAFHAHNILLQVGVDLGIPGLIAWLTLFFIVLKQGWTMLQDGRRTHKRWLSNIGIAIICSQTALITHGMVDAVTWGMIRPAPIVWVVWGLALAYTKPMSQEQSEDNQQASQRNPPSPQA
jgi:putative inorganic carbon (HCO3(-)) transporter